MDMCRNHERNRVAARCRTCGDALCADCLVYSLGRLRPPYCVPCALSAAGVTPRVKAAPATEAPLAPPAATHHR